ncbi:post-GPI attachment to proteins factor 2 isoform X1 [Poecilia latipinna]|nr:PREDICTED: post-GPI attachment to proteins factor 2-like isoform X1 [Poecilia latipinna]
MKMLQGLLSNLDRDRDRPLIRVQFTSFAVATVLLPLSGLLACLLTSLMYHYEESTYTHCQVSNYLPSISSAISREPEIYIWRSCVGLHSAPRYLVTVAYFNFYRGRFSARLPELLLSGLALVSSLAENTGLLLLTYVASTESYKIHKYSFVVFIGCSLLHMLITCRLWFVIKRHYVNPEEKTSFLWKARIFLFNISCCAAAAYFFRRHNKYCEAGVYTLFAAFEYLVVFSNMAFHMTAFWDFGSAQVMVATLPEDKRY